MRITNAYHPVKIPKMSKMELKKYSKSRDKIGPITQNSKSSKSRNQNRQKRADSIKKAKRSKIINKKDSD